MTRSTTFTCAGLLALTLSCSSSGRGTAEGHAEVHDSAGVTIVDLRGELSGLATPRNDLERVFSVGEEGSGLALFQVSGARFLSSGPLVIANAGAPEVLVIDVAGRLVHRFGDAGEGPGQFGTITSVHVGDGSTIVTYDDQHGRLSEFDSTGALLGTRRLTDPSPVSDLIPLIASMTGPSLAVFGDNRHFGRGGTVHRDTTPLFRFTAASGDPDTLSLWPSKIWSFGNLGRGTTRSLLAFGPDLLVAGRTNRVALADTHEPRVSAFDENGRLIMLVHWAATPAPVTETDVEAWREERNAQLPGTMPDELRRQLLDAPHHETHSLLNGLALDAEGGVWIAPSVLKSDETQVWIVLSRGGVARGGVALPASARILDARAGRIAVLEKDELDVESVTVFSIAGFDTPR